MENFLLQGIGASYLGLEQYDNAIKYFEQVAAAIQIDFGAGDPSLTYPLQGLASAYYNQGRYADAERQINHVLATREKLLGLNSTYTAASLVDLAEVSRRQKKYTQSEDLYQRALRILENGTKPEHSKNWNQVLGRLAAVYEEQNKLAEVEALFERSIRLDQTSGPEKAVLLGSLAKVYVKEKKLLEAQKLYQQAFDIIVKSDPRRKDLTEILKEYADLLRNTHQESEAAKIEILARERASGMHAAGNP